jgi:BMFP domain-containing protein YqiC
MQSQNRFFDDFAKMATSAVGTLQSAGKEFETMMRQQMERLVAKMDLVQREEFDVVKEMAAEARLENERLKARIEVLEKAVGVTAKPSAPKAKAKAAPKTTRSRAKSPKSTAKKSTAAPSSEAAGS